MDPLKTVVSRLFVDLLDVNTADRSDRLLCGNLIKKRRFNLLHPKTSKEAAYDHRLIQLPLSSHLVDYETLSSDFLKTCQMGSPIAEHLKLVMMKYREPPVTLEKAYRLITFLHYILKETPPQSFPLSSLIEDLTPTLSLNLPQHYSIWIITLQFITSCLKINLSTNPPILQSLVKQIISEMTRLPAQEMSLIQHTCFSIGKRLLDLIFIQEEQTETNRLFTLSFFDFPELYSHFLTTAHYNEPNSATTQTPTATPPQPLIANSNVWLMTLSYMTSSILQDTKSLERISTLMAINIIKHILKEINTLPANLTTTQVDCINKGKELINLLLLGPASDGIGVVSHYDIILALPDVYGHFLGGTFPQSIHWTMEKFINELGKRRRHLAFLMMPPDASWPLISQMSRRHEYNDLTTRTSYHMFEGDLIEFVKEGNSTTTETHFRDMLYQRASMDEFRQLAKSLTQTGLDTTQIRKAMVSKIRDIIRCLQQHGKKEKNENEKISESYNPSLGAMRGEDIKMMIPDNLYLWELMTETADQLYSFVSGEFFSYEDILQDFYDLVYKPDGTPYSPRTKDHIKKDNGLVWLLLQLFYIEKVSLHVIQKDFEQDEKLFDKIVKLYNEEQIESKDAFTLRDLSLQCAINYQKVHIRDVINIKQRHPLIAASLQYASLCYHIQTYFNRHYHSNVPTNSTLFSDLDLQEMTKIAMESQLRQDVVPYTLYVYLVPTKADVDTIGHSSTTYIKGGTLCYKLLDLLCINAKHRLLQVIYKMMLDSEIGPRYQSPASPVACVPPNVLDVVYKLLYSAPCSAELMVKEIFDKLRRYDKIIKTKHTEDSDPSSTQLTDQTMRWLQTILQLMNYRFIRFLKYSPLSSGLLHYVRYSISYLQNRQCYQSLESFTLNNMQMDVKLLRSLDDPQREKPIWFAESEMLARLTVVTISRLIKTRGQADIKTDQIHRVLSSLYEHTLEWSSDVLAHFPPVIREYYDIPGSTRPKVTTIKIQQMVSQQKTLTSFLLQGSSEAEKTTLQHFSVIENQSSLLCILWLIALTRKTADCFHMPSVRKALLLIPPCRMATCVIDLMEFILSVDASLNSQHLVFSLLDAFVWKHQWVYFNYALFALTKGGSQEKSPRAEALLEHLLASPALLERVLKWESLEISHRPWTEENYSEKQKNYLNEYPEYHEFEGFAVNHGFDPVAELDPPLQTKLPIYFGNVINDFVVMLENVWMRMLENRQNQLLIQSLDRYGPLFRYHQCPLSFVANLFLYYYQSSVLADPSIRKRFLRLIDFEQYTIASEAIDYAQNDEDDGSAFDSGYFERAIYKLAKSINPQTCAPRSKPSLPERHFREIGSPAVEGIVIATLEIMLATTPSATIVKYLLDLALLRESHHTGVSALTIHAIGLLIPLLPQTFIFPIFEELNQLVMTNPYLLDVSEPCRLIHCGIPKRENGKYTFSRSLPDLSTSALKESISARVGKAMIFPYIFNDYTFNLHNYSTNAPNSFLTLFHSLVHYSSLDVFGIFLNYFQTLRNSGRLITDVQLLYVCFLVGPALHRIEKLDTSEAEFLIELMHIVKQVTSEMDLKDGWTTQALEQSYDFLYHIRTRFMKTNELAAQIREIIRSMNPPTSQRLLRLAML